MSPQRILRFGWPAGIGDVSWLWSKFYSLRDEVESVHVCPGWPRRTVPYMELWWPEEVRSEISLGYGDFQYPQILMAEITTGLGGPHGPPPDLRWGDLRDRVGSFGRILMEGNIWLEAGHRLESFLPDLPTEFHYPLWTSGIDKGRAWRTLAQAMKGRDNHRPLVGISCASYRGAEAWSTWGREEWKDFLRRVMAEGWQPLILGGFWDDLSHAVACDLELPDIVGQTSVAEMVEVLRVLPGYIGYSSGLNVIRTVLDRPAMAIWPHHDGGAPVDQAMLATSWVPPDMLESHRYAWALWRPVDEIWPVAKAFLRRCEDERTMSGKVESLPPPAHGVGP